MQSNRPLVSVVMPVYNHEAYVTQALNSILNQTYPNLEIIIIDDGSRDGSVKTIEAAIANWNQKKTETHRRTLQLIKQENRGAHHTINRGLALSKGEWLTILNSDDYYHLERIDTLIEQTEAAKAKMAFTYVVGIDSNNRPLQPDHWWWCWYDRTRCQLFTTCPTVGFQLLEHNLAVSTGNLFFSRSLYEEIGPFKDLKLAHDLDFLLRSIPVTEPLLVREDHYFYRLHGHNTQYQVKHLVKSEFNEIYREYLCMTFAKPPKNPQAPCHWYWPSEFAKWRSRLNMDHGLDTYIDRKPKKNKHAPSLSIPEVIQNKKSIRMTVITHELTLSGAPKLVTDLALSLSKNGYSPRVISLYDGPMRQVLEKFNIPVHILARRWKIWTICSLIYALCFRIKGKVIANSIMSWSVVLPLALIKPWKKPIWYIHESFTPFGLLKGKIPALLIALSKKLASPHLWFGSNSTRKAWAYSSFPQGKVMYWSGIPKKPEKSHHKTSLKHLLSVGTASSRKGTQTLIDAFILCIQENRIPSDVTLTIVGFPDQGTSAMSLLGDTILKVVTSGYRHRIHMIGSVDPDDLDSFFHETDIFVQSSVLECLPIALLTAMSNGLPIITTNVDGCAEAIQDKQTGYLCLPYDVNSLANALSEAINNPKQSIEVGNRAKEAFDLQFSLEATQKHVLNELNK